MNYQERQELAMVVKEQKIQDPTTVDFLGMVLGSQKKAHTIIRKYNNSLRDIYAGAALGQLHGMSGITFEDEAKIMSAINMGRSYFSEHKDRVIIRNEFDAMQYFSFLRQEEREVIVFAALDIKSTIIAHKVLFTGGLGACLCDARVILRYLIEKQGSATIMAHNHPSGDPEPSQEDLQLTKRLACATKLVGIDFLDHIIVGSNGSFSCKQTTYARSYIEEGIKQATTFINGGPLS